MNYLKTVILFFALSSILLAENESKQKKVFLKPFSQSFHFDKTQVKKGDTLRVLLDIHILEKHYVYWKQSGGSAQAFTFNWKLPEGVELLEIKYPQPKYGWDPINGSSFKNYDQTQYLSIFKIHKISQETFDMQVQVDWQVCEDNNGGCIQPDEFPKYNFSIKTGKETIKNPDFEYFYLDNYPEETPKDWKFHFHKENRAVRVSSSEFRKADVINFTVRAPHKINANTIKFFPENSALAQQYEELIFAQVDDKTIILSLYLNGNINGSIKGVLNWENQSFEVEVPLSDKALVQNHAQYLDLNGNTNVGKNSSLFVYIALAFLGGFILNLMPCVFPVLSIKVMGFVNQAKEGKGHGLIHAGMFTLGVIISMWVLAGIMLVLKSGNQDITWGYQLQNPYVNLTIILVLYVLALNLFGIFEIGISLTSAGQKIQGKSGVLSSFLSGILATVIATPCMAPMLGAALAYAFTQPPFISMIIFTFIGLGISSPYLFLAIFPKLLKFIPKPGPWMESFKQSMGLIMMLAVIWLLHSLQSLIKEKEMLFNILWSFVGVTLALWTYGRYCSFNMPYKTRVKGIVAALLIVTSSLWYGYSKVNYESELEWVDFSPAEVNKQIAKGKPVFIDFTATWCASCQVNKAIAMKPNAKLIKEKGIVMMKADNTKANPIINEWLKKYNSPGVPLNLFYNGKSTKPIKFPETFTASTFREQIEGIK